MPTEAMWHNCSLRQLNAYPMMTRDDAELVHCLWVLYQTCQNQKRSVSDEKLMAAYHIIMYLLCMIHLEY